MGESEPRLMADGDGMGARPTALENVRAVMSSEDTITSAARHDASGSRASAHGMRGRQDQQDWPWGTCMATAVEVDVRRCLLQAVYHLDCAGSLVPLDVERSRRGHLHGLSSELHNHEHSHLSVNSTWVACAAIGSARLSRCKRLRSKPSRVVETKEFERRLASERHSSLLQTTDSTCARMRGPDRTVTPLSRSGPMRWSSMPPSTSDECTAMARTRTRHQTRLDAPSGVPWSARPVRLERQER